MVMQYSFVVICVYIIIIGERIATMRAVSVDGIGRPLTMDYWPSRINVEIENGKIAKIVRSG